MINNIDNINNIKEGMTFKNYRRLCEYLGEPIKTGNSKILQVKRWSQFFKMEKDKQKITIAEVYDFPRIDIDGRCKNIVPMIQYLQLIGSSLVTDDYLSFTTWFCDKLELIDEALFNVVYYGDEAVEDYCSRNDISDPKLLSRYVSIARSELKNIFLTTLRYMKEKSMLDYKLGYKIFYRIKRGAKGYVNTDILNDDLINNETMICDDMNKKYEISNKMSGRQILLVIYGNRFYTREFDKRKCQMIMEDEEALKKLNEKLSCTYGDKFYPISEEHPIINYYKAIMITSINFESPDINDPANASKLKTLTHQIFDILKKRTRIRLERDCYHNEPTEKSCCLFDSSDNDEEIDKIEKAVFYFHSRKRDTTWDEIARYGAYHLSFPQEDEEEEEIKSNKYFDETGLWDFPEKAYVDEVEDLPVEDPPVEDFDYAGECWSEEELEILMSLK